MLIPVKTILHGGRSGFPHGLTFIFQMESGCAGGVGADTYRVSVAKMYFLMSKNYKKSFS